MFTINQIKIPVRSWIYYIRDMKIIPLLSIYYIHNTKITT